MLYIILEIETEIMIGIIEEAVEEEVDFHQGRENENLQVEEV